MFFRFAAALGLLTALSLAAITVEKQNLSCKRTISLQHYQLQALRERRCRLVLETQQLGAPLKLLKEVNQTDDWQPSRVDVPVPDVPPLLEWRLRER